MIESDLRQRAIALYDRFTHEHRDRRAFMRELGLLAGGAAAAQVLLESIAPGTARAAIVSPSDPRVKSQEISWPGANGHTLTGYTARLSGAIVRRPAVMIVHENRGLNDHIRDIARRLALAGYLAVAPDFLSPFGGTPANEDAARDKIEKLELAATVADGVATVGWLRRVAQSTGQVGTIGFCWGGGLVNRIAAAAGPGLLASVSYYGPAPDPAFAARVKSAMLLHYAGLDDRVNATGKPWIEALQAAHVDTEAYIYANVNHAFNNDTSPARYDKASATLAWARTIVFLGKHL